MASSSWILGLLAPLTYASSCLPASRIVGIQSKTLATPGLLASLLRYGSAKPGQMRDGRGTRVLKHSSRRLWASLDDDIQEGEEHLELLGKSGSPEEVLRISLGTPQKMTTEPEFEEQLEQAVRRLDPMTYPKLSRKLIDAPHTAQALADLSNIDQSLGGDNAYATSVGKQKLRIHGAILNAMRKELLENAGWDDYSPEDLADIAWACAVVRAEVPELFSWIKEAIYRKPNYQFTPEALSKLVWSWMSMRQEDYQVVTRLLTIASAPNFLGSFTRKDVAILLDALESLDLECEGIGELLTTIGEFFPLLKERALQIEATEKN